MLHIPILIPETSLLILVTPRSSMSAGVNGESSQALPGVSGKQSPPCAERSCRSLSSPPLAGVVARPSFPPSVPSLATAPGSALPPTVAHGSLLALCPCRGSPRFTPIREPLLCPPLPQPRSHGGPGSRVTGHRADWRVERVAFFRLRKGKAPPRNPNVKTPNGGRLRGTAAPAGNRRRHPGKGDRLGRLPARCISCDTTEQVQGHEKRKLRECVL